MARLKEYRRLATRYEKLAASSADMVTLAVIRLYLKTHLPHTPETQRSLP